jgi:hypothetical protein
MKLGVHLPSSPKRPSHRHLRSTCITAKIGHPHIKQNRSSASPKRGGMTRSARHPRESRGCSAW